MEDRNVSSEFTQIDLGVLFPSSTNPRVQRDEASDAELVDSVRRLGVLQPILVRPRPPKGIGFEIVAGHRRYGAAKEAGLTRVPALVRQLTDVEVLEIQIVENLQRSDVHPLDEANAYLMLHELHDVEVARIAERVGRSVPYVYERMRLTRLVPEAQEQFRAGRFAAAHAVLLARLRPEDQHRAMDLDSGALYQNDVALGLDDLDEAEDEFATVKPRSARELQTWIQRNARLSVANEELPQLFPENIETLGLDDQACDRADLIEVTWLSRVEQPIDGHIYTMDKWHPASPKFDGPGGTPGRSCELSKPGVIVLGPERGRVLPVCISKKCPVHFPKKLSAAAAAAEAAKPKTAKQLAAEERERKQREAHEAERARWVAFNQAWGKTESERIKRALSAVASMSTQSLVKYGTDVILKDTYGTCPAQVKKFVVASNTAESVLRVLVALKVYKKVLQSWDVEDTIAHLKKHLKTDLQPIVEAALAKDAGQPKAAAKKPAKKGGTK